MNKKRAVHFLGVIAAVITGIAAFRFGYWLIVRNSGRSPAAVHNPYDFSQLKGDALLHAAKDRVVSGTKTVTAGEATGLELGHFYVSDNTGSSVPACEYYKYIKIIFIAGDMAVSGESPEMIVRGDCLMGENNVIGPMLINTAQILPEKAVDRSFSSVSTPHTTVAFKNVSDSWPKIWVLKSVTLFNEKSEITIEQDDYRRFSGRVFTLNW